jgi:hypothetical protein
MLEPGFRRHEWESEMAVLEDDLASSPVEALPELDALVARMLEETGYDLADPVVREGEEREIVTEYLAAHEIAQGLDRDTDGISLGDVADAINGLREIFDFLVENRSAIDSDVTPSGEVAE